jgi:exodeoxyribonuclease-3
MRIATFNANSIRVRLDAVLDWLARHEPDVLALQETKCEDSVFPAEAFEEMGYHVVHHGQKTYNGVAIVSRSPALNVARGFGFPDPDDRRLIAADIDGVRVINTYVPNGTRVGSDKFAYKLAWLSQFRDWLDRSARPDSPMVWLGDMNIAPTPDDVYDSAKLLGSVGHHPEEFAALAHVVDWGWQDVFRRHHQGPGHYTYWDYVVPTAFSRNLGWRIDHIYASASFAPRCRSCVVDREPRAAARPSDHTFVVADFD